MEIRPEQEQDQAAVYRLNSSAFAGNAEARLVDALRKLASPIVSLVAIVDNQVTGHILFSPVQHSNDTDALIMGLAPMAVAEEARN